MNNFTEWKTRRVMSLMVKILISLVCCVAIWKWIELEKLGRDLKGILSLPFAMAVFLNLGHKVLNAVKIRLLFPAPRPALRKLIAVNFITVFFTAFLPGGVGGEIARWTYLTKESQSKSFALAVILLDRTTALWSQIFLAVMAWLWISDEIISLWVGAPVALIVIMGSLWAGLWGYRGLATTLGKIGDWYARKRGNSPGGFEDIGQALVELLATRRRFWMIVGLSLSSQLVVVTTFLFIDRSVGGHMPVPQAMLLLFCYTLVLLLPVTLGNWGLSEGTLAILYHYAGSQGATGVLISLLLRLMDLPAALVGWVLFLNHRTQKPPKDQS
jgi:glycosyltransferase 2 family protein